MRHLENRCAELVRSRARQERPLSPSTQVSGQEHRATRGDGAQNQRAIVAVATSRRRRVQNLEPPGAQRRPAATPQWTPRQTGFRPERVDAVGRGQPGRRPDLADRKVRGQLDQAPAVIQVRMADHHRVEPPHPSPGQRRHQHSLGDVQTVPATAVHQQRTPTVPEQDRLALSDVQHHHLEARAGAWEKQQEQGGGEAGATAPPRARQQRRADAQGDRGGANPATTIDLDRRHTG